MQLLLLLLFITPKQQNQWRRAIEALEARAPPRRCGDSG